MSKQFRSAIGSSGSSARERDRERDNSETNEWIEIIEPKSKVQMFANLITGECRWDEPRGHGIVISRATNPSLTQWWELYDTNSQRFYYYCAKDSKTVWKRPTTPDAIVVPLAKLQILKQNTSSGTHATNSAVNDDNRRNSVCRTSDVCTQTEPQLCSRATQTTEQTTQTTASYGLTQNAFRNPSLKHYLISEARLTHAMTRRRLEDNTDISHELDCYDSNDDFDDVLDSGSDLCDADDEYDDDYDYEYSDDADDSDELDDTDDDIRRRRDVRPVVHRDRERQPVNSVYAAAQTSPTTSNTTPSVSLVPTKSHSLTQISSNIIRNNSNNQNISKRLTTATTTDAEHVVNCQTLSHIRPQTPTESHTLSLIPTPTTTTSLTTQKTTQKSDLNKEIEKTSLLSIESFAKENIERHRKRGIFIGKKVSLKSMLEWSKKSIKKPMISSISDQKLRHESKLMFKFVQKFMRDLTEASDRQTSSGGHERHQLSISDDIEITFYLLTTATQQPILRDELLVQIARQTTNNPSLDSELRGLRLMCACFWYFPPSHKLAPHLNAFLFGHSNAFARDVVKRKFEQQLRRSQQSHVVYVRKPYDLEEVSRVLRCVNNGFVGVFGETLSDALVDQRLIPWPIISLTEALLKCRGNDETSDCCEREGVFRCVGDLDEVMKLKIKIDTIITRGATPTTTGTTATTGHDSIHSLSINSDDIHVIASTLKLYFRELKEPLIPFSNYWEALESAHDFKRAKQLIEKLPKLNRLSLSYLIRFLQVFSAPEHVIYTKMDDANLSMVWAPNILRSDQQVAQALESSSLSNIFERTRSEMSFVRTLIQNFDTSFMSGVQ